MNDNIQPMVRLETLRLARDLLHQRAINSNSIPPSADEVIAQAGKLEQYITNGPTLLQE